MIVLDTNVVSELMAKSPHPKVAEWSRKFRRDELAMTTITFMELRMGIETLPASKRRVGLEADLDGNSGL